MMFEKQEKGYILITGLLLLLVLTVVGMAALGTSTLDNIYTGNIYTDERQCAESDSGLPYTSHIVSKIVFGDDPPAEFSNLLNAANIANDILELRSVPFAVNDVNYTASMVDATFDPAPDLQFMADGDTVNVDIDKIGSGDAMFGGGKINHNCYKGAGKCDGKSRIYHYRINSRSFNLAGECLTGSYYRYVDK